MRYIWSTTVVFMAVVGEVAVGSQWAIPLPLTCLAIFYLAVGQGPRSAMPGAVVAAVLLDIQFGRALLPTLFILPLIFELADGWRAHGDSANPFGLSVPGGLLGLTGATVAWYLAHAVHRGAFGMALSTFLVVGAASAIAGALALPLLAIFCDAVAGRSGLTRIADIRPPRKRLHA